MPDLFSLSLHQRAANSQWRDQSFHERQLTADHTYRTGSDGFPQRPYYRGVNRMDVSSVDGDLRVHIHLPASGDYQSPHEFRSSQNSRSTSAHSSGVRWIGVRESRYS